MYTHRERVFLVYQLIKGLPINVGDVMKQNMLKSLGHVRDNPSVMAASLLGTSGP